MFSYNNKLIINIYANSQKYIKYLIPITILITGVIGKVTDYIKVILFQKLEYSF